MSDTPWHAASWAAFLTDGLPRLLAERLPLVGYGADLAGASARISVCVGVPPNIAEAEYDIPLPNEDGVFHLNETPRVAPPVASSDDLAEARIACVGEQFAAYVDQRLGSPPDAAEWDEETLRSVLPLDEWAAGFVGSAQRWDTNNLLSARTHLRRIILPRGSRMFAPGHTGRTCPAETPENENIGRVLTVARGAEIRDGGLVIVDDRPEASLGLSASALPFLQHIDPARALMACNLQRQWLTPPDPEPALVQTGLELPEADFWCGRNLLTAYVSMGLDTFEDSLAVSESAALRLGYPEPLEVGDKLSNRSGNKGVVARIVPDAEMPRLEDGTPVELAMSPNSIYSRMTLGQLREAALSWAAHRRGAPIVFPPLSAPTRNEMDTLLEEAGLLADGMLPLVDGRTCRTFERPATVGWVYWGKLTQRASKAHFASASLHPRSQRWGASEFDALRLAGADAVIRSVFGVQASDSPAAQAVADRVAEGADPDTGDAMPVFARLQRRLARTGIRAELVGGRVRYCLSRPDEPLLKLAMPLPHPWLPAHTIEEVGAAGRMPAFQDLVRANARAERMLAATAPEGLKTQALDALKSALAAYFDTMVGKHTFRITGRNEQSGRLAFSARAVATPGDGLAPDQVGIPEAMAWSLFAPFLVHAVGVGAVEARSAEAAAELDRLMARMWVLVHRHPTTGPSSILAFHPIRVPGRVIRIHPMACVTLNADFDGDVLGVVLPVTEAAQEQAGRALTIAAHVEKDRASGRCARPVYEAVFGPMTHQVRPTQDSRFGLARLCMTPEGLAEVAALSGVEPVLENGMLTTSSVCGMLDRVLAEKGVAPMLEVASKLWYRGLAASRDIGASLTPFPTAPCEAPPKPDCDDVDAWAAYQDEYAGGMMAAYWDCRDDTDPARVTLLSGARGTARMWIQAVGVRGVVRSADGGLTVERHSVSEGLTPEETLVGFVGMRHGLTAGMYWVDMQKEMRSCQVEIGYGVLERALRSNRPGVVFARAAAAEEHDRLDTVRSRLMVSGLSQR